MQSWGRWRLRETPCAFSRGILKQIRSPGRKENQGANTDKPDRPKPGRAETPEKRIERGDENIEPKGGKGRGKERREIKEGEMGRIANLIVNLVKRDGGKSMTNQSMTGTSAIDPTPTLMIGAGGMIWGETYTNNWQGTSHQDNSWLYAPAGGGGHTSRNENKGMSSKASAPAPKGAN